MTKVKPIHPEHSVVEVAFALQFSSRLDEAQLRSVSEMEGRLKDFLPKKEEATAIDFEIRNNEISPSRHSQTLAEVKFSHYASDGTADWLMRVNRNLITVSCFAYERWHTVWPEAKRLLSMVGSALVSPTTPIGAISLQYIDRFLYLGDQRDYSAGELFNLSSPYLTPKSLEAGPYWHIHQGWFDATPHTLTERESRLLNRLNINAAAAEGEHQTTIDHFMSWQFRDAVSKRSAIFEDPEQLLEKSMAHLHDNNKATLRRLLSDDVLAQIGLAEG